MDEPVFLSLDEIEDERLKREGKEDFSPGGDFLQGLRLGRTVGTALNSAGGLLAGMRRAVEGREKKVMDALTRDPKMRPFAGKVKEVMGQMKPAWWTARAKNSPEEIARELTGYAMERLRREEKRAERAETPAGENRWPTPEEVKRDGWLNVQTDERIRQVVEKTVSRYCGLEPPPVRDFPLPVLKKWEGLSPSSAREYKKVLLQTQRELRERGARSPWDVAAYLAEKTRTVSRSRYNLFRACVIQIAAAKGDKTLIAVIRSIPPYKNLCDMTGATPTPRVGEITRARRRKKDAETWGTLMNACSEQYRDIFRLIRITGCRVGETESIRLRREDDGSICVKIQTSKRGARKKGSDALPWREILFRPGTAENKFLISLIALRGEAPAEGMTAHALQGAWARARRKVGVYGSQEWCLHALRHAYAAKRRKEIDGEKAREHGPDWRKRLYGKSWKSDPEVYKKYFHETYGELARELGHTCEEMTKKYG